MSSQLLALVGNNLSLQKASKKEVRHLKYISILTLSIVLCSGTFESAVAQQTIVGGSDGVQTNSNIKGPLEFKGFVKELSKKLKGAIVVLYESPDGSHENLTELYRTVSPGSGMFEFKLEINKHFVLAVEKGGYTTKKIDFDTDVTLARKQHTKVAKFEFELDMVKDLDGLPFVGAVAHVFYQIKSNTFNYQLDYTKDELENEEIDRLEKERKQIEAELAYQKKEDLKEAAQVLLDKESASAQQVIEAAVKIGDGNKGKTVKGFLDVFAEADTLRERKALAMYGQLLEERKKANAGAGKIDFQAVFQAASVVESEAESKAETERQALVSALRKEKETTAAKDKEALVIQRKVAEQKAAERLAGAVAAEELRVRQEQKETRDEVYYAIFNANGSSTAAVANLIKTYSKSDLYRVEKANAIYVEYEKTRLTGTTLSNMDFGNLFNAADVAEQEAIHKEIESEREEGKSVLEAFKLKVEAQKQKEQQEISRKIEKGLEDAPKDRASQISVFENALLKNEPNKGLKAEAMYEQYVKQQKSIREIETGLTTAASDSESQKAVFYNALSEDTPDRKAVAQRMYDNYIGSKQAQGGSGTISMDFGSMFQVADNAAEEAKKDAFEENALEIQAAQDQLEARRQGIRKEKQQLAAKAEKDVKNVHKAGMADAKNKKEKALESAIEKGGGDRDKSVVEISKALPETGDKELDRNRAEAVYDAYLKENREIERSGRVGEKVNFAVLFGAAEKAELESLQNQYEKTEAAKAITLVNYEERRIEKATAIAKAEQVKAEREVAAAEIEYEETLHKTEAMRIERLAEEKKKEEVFAKEIAMDQAKRDVLEKERADGELAVVKAARLERLERESKNALALAKAEEDKKKKLQELANKAAEERLALLNKQEFEAEEERRKEEKAKTDERERLALAKSEADAAAKKAEADAVAQEEKKLKSEELAAAKAEQERLSLAEKAKKEADNKAKANALAVEKDTKDRLKEEERIRLATAQKAEFDALAAQKEEEKRAKAKEERLAEAARVKAQQDEDARKANYDALVSKGDVAMSKEDYRVGYKNYQSAKALYPDNKDVVRKFKEAEMEVGALDQAVADQLALDTRYSQFMQEAEQDLSQNNFDAAKAKFRKASELKPDEREPKQKIRNINRTLEQIAADNKVEVEKERKYILLIQNGATALESNSLAQAKDLYLQASRMKPDDATPKAKLEEIQKMEDELATAAIEEDIRKESAKLEFENKQAEAKREKEAKLAARLLNIADADAAKEETAKTDEEREIKRIAQFEDLQEELRKMDLNAEEARATLLSELAKIYPEGLTEETVDGKNFVLSRHVINERGAVTIYEKKVWDWGGQFYFKDTDIAITEAIYKLEIGKY
ncbi:MAG: hypothetical protein ACI9EQ_000936 [Bacteroidia bacterium]